MLWKGYYPLCSSLVCCPSQATPRQRDGTAESKWEELQWGSRWHTNVWIGLGHHLSTPGLNCQQKMDFTRNFFSIYIYNRRGSVLSQCKHQIQLFTLPVWIQMTQPYCQQATATHQTANRQQQKHRKQFSSSSSRESVIQSRRCRVHLNSGLSFAFREKDLCD